MALDRRSLLLAMAGSPVATIPLPTSAQARPFGFQDVQVEAIKLSGMPFRPPALPIPEPLAHADYDAYRGIRFRAGEALWNADDVLFQVQFFHLGFVFATPVRVNVVERGEARPVAFRKGMFAYPDPALAAAVPDEFAFSGFRLHFPLNQSGVFDEFMVFQGASYFRIVGRGQHYGLSTRGLAINSGGPGPEEFPLFREFWIEKPAPGATEIVLYALLDSESVTGAYRFGVRPGNESPVEVTAILFPRRDIPKLGLAPMTSMFMMGENQARLVDDYRPEVHDSDGLLLRASNGDRLWRPLNNPKLLRVNAFADPDIRGFGLLQRDRDFANYQDLEADYNVRPSLWAEPLRPFGAGAVQLVEIPTDTERHDNIVAFWTPAGPALRGQRLEWSYRLTSFLGSGDQPPLGWVVATRTSPSPTAGGRRLFVDFTGRYLQLLHERQEVKAIVAASAGRLENVVVQKNEATAGWRAFFDYFPPAEGIAELRCALTLLGERITETWVYPWPA